MPTAPGSCHLASPVSLTLAAPHAPGTVASLGLPEPTKQAVSVPPRQGLRQGLGQVVDLGDEARRQEWERGEKPVKGCVIKKGCNINGAGVTGSP